MALFKRKVLILLTGYQEMLLTVLSAAFLFSASLEAQTKISGLVVDDSGRVLSRVNVLLLKSLDSTLVKGILSGEDGGFLFANVSAGSYVITATAIGYKQVYSPVITTPLEKKEDTFRIVLSKAVTELNTVTVTGRKPLYEQKPDRLVINVQNSITSAGNTALDVLERSPGVSVNRQSNSISLIGKEGVMLMINGKISYMPAEAVIELLNGMSSNNIEKIELITTPPASVDAEGKAGLINIVLKSNNNFGTNGSFTATLGYGKGPVTEASGNLNFRREKLNIYGNLSFSRIEKPLPINSETHIVVQGVARGVKFDAGRTENVVNFNGRIGFDYQLSARTIVGVLITGYDNDYKQHETNKNLILRDDVIDTLEIQKNHETNHWKNISANFNVQHDFSQGSRLALNLDYIYYDNHQPYNYSSAFFNNAGEFLSLEIKRTSKYTPINFLIGALDYSLKLGNKCRMDVGLKRTVADFTNELALERFSGGSWALDSASTATQKLNEDYTAAYVSIDLAASKKDNLKVGLRYEYTNSNLGSTAKTNIVDRHYGNLFPVFNYNRVFNKNNSLTVSFSSRISRPTFNQLAPYIYFMNGSTSITGNPALQPTISNTITASYSFRKYLASLSVGKEKDPIWIFQPTADTSTGKIVLTPENLRYQKLASLMIAVPLNLTRWWTSQFNATVIWQDLATYGEDPLKLSKFNFNLTASETFRLSKTVSMEVSGFYQSPRYAGITLQKAYGSLDFGVRKKLAGRNGTLSFTATNLLLSQDLVLTTNYPQKNLDTYFSVNFVQRSFKISYTRNFGNDKLKEKRERNTGAEEEKGRVQ